MKILHCADLHLDSRLTAWLSPEQARERRGELLQTFRHMIEYADREHAEAVLIAGDLFDRRQISAAARNAVLDVLRKHPQTDVYYVTGNHERDGFLQAVPEIPGNLKLFGEEWRSYERGPVTVTGADLRSGNGADLFASLVLDPGKFNIVLLHGLAVGYASGRQAETVDLGALRNKNIDYLALGHLHAHQEGPLPPRGVWCYPGCLEARGFDECGEHGFVMLDIDATRRTCARTFVPFASRRAEEIEVDVTGCLSSVEIADRIEERLLPYRDAGQASPDLWKLILTGQVDIACEKDLTYLQQRFADRCYVLKVEDRTRLAVDYRAYALDASLKGEFVRLVEHDGTLDEQEKAEIIRCGIQALAGEELLA